MADSTAQEYKDRIAELEAHCDQLADELNAKSQPQGDAFTQFDVTAYRMDAYNAAIRLVKEARAVIDRHSEEYGIDVNDVLRVARFLVGDREDEGH